MQRKELMKYHKKLEREAKKFRLTAEDLSNLTDLELMLPGWFIKEVLKPNKLEKWFYNFFNRVEAITIEDNFIKHNGNKKR